MFKIIFSLIFLFNFNSYANVAFEVKGKLIFTKESPIKMVLKSNEGDFHISNKNYYTYGCKKGAFMIVSNYAPRNTYSIVEVMSCKDFDNNSKQKICPKNLDFVCGAPIEFKCENHYCERSEMEPRTFSNRCQLLKNGARFLYEGPCGPM